MEEQVRKLVSFPAEDGHIESVLVGVQEVKVSFQDWRGRKLVILFHDVEEFHGIDSIGVSEEQAKGTIRVSFSKDNTLEEAVELAETLNKIVSM